MTLDLAIVKEQADYRRSKYLFEDNDESDFL